MYLHHSQASANVCPALGDLAYNSFLLGIGVDDLRSTAIQCNPGPGTRDLLTDPIAQPTELASCRNPELSVG